MILSRLELVRESFPSKFRPVAGWVAVGSLVAALGTSMMVAEAAQGDPGTGVKCDPAFNAAVANALTRHVKVVDIFMSQAQTQMQNAVSASGNKCIGDIAFGDFDISGLIPDLGGLLGALVQSVVQRIIDGLTKRFCTAVNDQLKGAETSWNDAVNGINKQLNIEGQMQVWGNNVDARVKDITDRCVVNPAGCTNNTGPSPISTPPVIPASAATTSELSHDIQPAKPTIPTPTNDFSLPVRQ